MTEASTHKHLRSQRGRVSDGVATSRVSSFQDRVRIQWMENPLVLCFDKGVPFIMKSVPDTDEWSGVAMRNSKRF